MEGLVKTDPRFDYHQHLATLSAEDVQVVVPKDVQYGASWKRRGGVGAYMMLVRKWDRIENAMDPTTSPGDPREAPLARFLNKPVPAFDILAAAEQDTRPDGLLDDIKDLRRYLLLLEAEVVHRRRLQVEQPGLRSKAPEPSVRPRSADMRTRSSDLSSTAPGELS